MVKRIFAAAVFLTVLAMSGHVARADNVSLVLQNGLNGYSGCTDTYFDTNGTVDSGQYVLMVDENVGGC